LLTPRAEIARERRRQMQVRQAFGAGLEPGAEWQGRSPADFHLACADYLLFSMDRLHEQDQRIHDLLKARIPAAERDAHERLDVLDRRQTRSRELLAGLRRAAQALRGSGGRAIAAFEGEAREFIGAFGTLLQPRKNPFFRHTDQLFTDADWASIAGVTPQSLAEEDRLFAGVRRSAPAGADPDTFTAGHLPAETAEPVEPFR
jgi:hypothetical protein